MNLKKNMLRTASAAILVAGLAGAAPAVAQDLVVAFKTPPTTVAFGGTTKYTVTITNSSATAAAGVKVSATIPAGTSVTAVTGCTPADATTTPVTYFPCTITTPIPALTPAAGTTPAAPGVATVSVSVKYAKLDALPETCPAADTFGPVGITAAFEADPDTANNTVSLAPALKPLADLGVTFEGPATLSHNGGTYTWTITVTNNGPCAIAGSDIAVDDGVLSSGLTFKSATGICAAMDGDFLADGSDYQYCPVPALAKGGTATATKTYDLVKVPADLLQSLQANGIQLVPSGAAFSYTEPGVSVTKDAAGDPVYDTTGNDVADMNYVVGNSGGCSTAGGALPFGLLGLGLALQFMKRRRSNS